MANKIPRCISMGFRRSITSIRAISLPPAPITAASTRSWMVTWSRLETQGLGRLKINVRDDLKRTWARETRLERHRKKLAPITPQLTGKHAPAQK